MRITRWDADGVRFEVPFRGELASHAETFHGGVLSTLIDAAARGAVLAGHDFANGSRLSTVGMTVHYLSAAGQEDLVAEAVCTRRGRNLNYVHVDADEHHAVMEIAAELADEDAGREHVVVDHFIVDDGGLVTRMAVYLRPDEVDATRARLAQS